ncbi:hypothetical protein FDV98_26095 [Escherichia coli]|nr:hypothetical protein ELT32_21970 [Escherichia coli]
MVTLKAHILPHHDLQPPGCRGSQYTLVSGPDGPLTRRYAPTSGKPSSGPLRPRTEALSWLKAGMA